MFGDADQVWWIVPPGQQIRHAITDRPGSRPSGDSVPALCGNTVKLPYDTWPANREPASRRVTEHCSDCEAELSRFQDRGNLVVSTWDI